MNGYLIFIISILTGVFALDGLSDILNLGRLRDDLPREFSDFYDSQKYKQSLSYQREKVHFSLFQRALAFAALITFLLLGGFNWVDTFARSLGWSDLATGLVFAGTLTLLQFCLQLPFSIYDTFVIEEKYGFNRTSPRTFALDLLKGALIGGTLGGMVFAGIVTFFSHAGPYAWLECWVALTFFQILLSFLAPTFLLPLFNKFTPLPEGALRESIERYANTRHFKLSGIFTMDSSKRSSKSNAFFTGFGKFRRLVLFDTLISKHSIEELVAILAHEIGHFERKHILKSITLSILVSGVMLFTLSLFMNSPELFAAFKMDQVSVYASLVFAGIVYSPFLRFLSLFTQMLSRKHEFEADDFAVQTYGNPEVLIMALKKLSVDNLSHLTPHPLKVALDYTHPPILQRIDHIRKRLR